MLKLTVMPKVTLTDLVILTGKQMVIQMLP
jgi:hypothetical protein